MYKNLLTLDLVLLLQGRTLVRDSVIV